MPPWRLTHRKTSNQGSHFRVQSNAWPASRPPPVRVQGQCFRVTMCPVSVATGPLTRTTQRGCGRACAAMCSPLETVSTYQKYIEQEKGRSTPEPKFIRSLAMEKIASHLWRGLEYTG